MERCESSLCRQKFQSSKLATGKPLIVQQLRFVIQLRESFLRNESMNNREQTYAAIEKMLQTLNDPFTRFLPPSKASTLKGGTKGIQ